jgi:hypothetical protein
MLGHPLLAALKQQTVACKVAAAAAGAATAHAEAMHTNSMHTMMHTTGSNAHPAET